VRKCVITRETIEKSLDPTLVTEARSRRSSLTRSRPDPSDSDLTAPERRSLPLVPTRELVVFPKMIAPLFVGREKSVRALERAHAESTDLILSSQREPLQDDPGPDDILPIGTMATVLQLYGRRTAA